MTHYIIVGTAKIGDTPFDGKLYVGLDLDGSVELRAAKADAFQLTEQVAALTLSQLLTTHHSSTLSFVVEAVTVSN